MTQDRKTELFVNQLLQQATRSGLSPNEIVTALGMAAKAITTRPFEQADNADCDMQVRTWFEAGFTTPMKMVWAASDLTALRRSLSEAEMRDILDNTNIIKTARPRLH